MALDDSWFTEMAKGYGMSIKIREKIHDENSRYQHIEIYDSERFGRLMTLDGITMLTGRDNFIYHEMMTHPALFAHARPLDVVIVGGGDCGSLREVLKHPDIRTVTQVELDERVTRVSEQFFPELCASNGDPRATLLFEDAIAWMRDATADSADVIVLDTTDPVGQAERLFSMAFYRDCHRVLRDGGILVAQSESPFLDLDILKGLRGEMTAAGFGELRTLQFYLPTYPSGWWSATLAAKNHRFERLGSAGDNRSSVETRYYSPEIVRAAVVLPPWLQAELGQISDIRRQTSDYRQQ